jgi:hypothetical protein
MKEMMILLAQISDPLTIVTTAVTPVVMVSATAILISGVNARYISISDRVRNLAHEFRSGDPSPERRQNIHQQMLIFNRRIGLVSWAARTLYVAVGLFVTVALLIGVSMWRRIFSEITLPIFITALVLVAIAILLQFGELQLSNRTITLESADVLNDAQSGEE